MPHVTIEYSRNVIEELDFHPIFIRIHEALHSLGTFAIEDIKSRAICYDRHAVGAGRPQSAFAHVQLSILEGRPAEIRTAAGQAILEILRESFHRSWEELQMNLSVEVREMKRDSFFRADSDGPTHVEA